MLLGNGHVYNKAPGRSLGGGIQAGSRGAWYNQGARRNAYTSATYSRLSAIPNNLRPPYTWVIPSQAGGIGSRHELEGLGDATAAGAMGVNAEAAIDSAALLAALGELVVTGDAQISGGSDFVGSILAAIAAAATVEGLSELGASIDALGHSAATMAGLGAVSATLTAIGTLGAAITTITPLSPEGLASSLWGAVASDYNEPGSLGEKINAAGSAADPWGAELESYNAGTAGAQLKKVLTVSKFAGLK
jgi:hypothetical protein